MKRSIGRFETYSIKYGQCSEEKDKARKDGKPATEESGVEESSNSGIEHDVTTAGSTGNTHGFEVS